MVKDSRQNFAEVCSIEFRWFPIAKYVPALQRHVLVNQLSGEERVEWRRQLRYQSRLVYEGHRSNHSPSDRASMTNLSASFLPSAVRYHSMGFLVMSSSASAGVWVFSRPKFRAT